MIRAVAKVAVSKECRGLRWGQGRGEGGDREMSTNQ